MPVATPSGHDFAPMEPLMDFIHDDFLLPTETSRRGSEKPGNKRW